MSIRSLCTQARSFVVLLFLLLMPGGCGTLLHAPDEADQEKDAVILDVETGHTVDEEALLEKMLGARVIYLGEKHDNPHHHRLQRILVERLIARGQRPALGFEFFSRDQTGWLMNFSVGKPSSFAPHGRDEKGTFLRKKLGWETRKDWAFYFPLVALARTHHLPVFGADLPGGTRVRLARSGLEGLSAVEKLGLSPTHLQHDDYQTLMKNKLALAHCGMAKEPLLERLYATWLARNDAMAQAIVLTLEERPNDPVVILLGAGHIANDMGVYERVAFLKPGVQQVNLAFQETRQPDPPLSQYTQPVHVGQTTFSPGHHFLWFTPPAPDDEKQDPCEQMRRHQQKK